MLDFLLVLGQVPGTSLFITFNELVSILCVFFLLWEERRHHRAIVRWFKWLRYRVGVNYRRRKRMVISYIKHRRYRIAIFERRIIRNTKTFLRRKRHAMYMILFYRRYSSLKRRYYKTLIGLERMERRIRRSHASQVLADLRNIVKNPI